MEKETVGIRPYLPEENQAKQFYGIAKEAFFYGSPWTMQQYEETLSSNDMFFFVAEFNQTIIGYIGGKILLDEGEIYTIVVKQTFQKRAIATRLLDAFKNECKIKGAVDVFLEVRVSNEIARRFYEKNGFDTIAVRKQYYTFPREDAIIMKCTLRKKEEDDKEANLSDRNEL